MPSPFIPIQILAMSPLLLPQALFAQDQLQVPIKHIASHPDDIISKRLALPDPSSLSVHSTTALIAVEPEMVNGIWEWSMDLDVHNAGAKIVFLSAQPGTWTSTLRTPNGAIQELQSFDQIARASIQIDPRLSIGSSTLEWLNQDRRFDHLTIQEANAGQWRISLHADHDARGYLLIDDGAAVTMSSHVTMLETLKDQPITINADWDAETNIQSLTAEIRSPSGTASTVQADADSHQLTFFPEESGAYSVHLIAQSITPSGTTLIRTAQHLIHAAEPAPLLGAATTTLDDGTIKIRFASENTDRRTILAAEVWGKVNGIDTPITWISSIVGSDRSLNLNPSWISYFNADPSKLELRNVRLHDIESFVPIETIVLVSIDNLPELRLPSTPQTITQAMLQGEPSTLITANLPEHSMPSLNLSDSTTGPGHRLMLSHGYCSGATPFTIPHFSGDLALFEDFNQSRSHDEFALLMLAQSAPMKSFGVVGHSQAGMAALHLYTYYWSGLNWARGNRLIQTVGAPYQGTALAGNAAVLGDIFGFGCGENDNMTYTGSANWLSLIPTWAREEVYYYTTSFEDGFGFDFCNFITDLLLSDPDDGVIERSAGQLPGANNMGHLEGWCHTSDMRDPGQCTDPARNAIMNQEARR